MSSPSPQPFDLVLGRHHTPPPEAAMSGSVVLGGLAGLQQQFSRSPHFPDRLQALTQALQYPGGVEFVQMALDDEPPDLVWAAYDLLKHHPTNPSRNYHSSPYSRFCQQRMLFNDRRHKIETLALSPDGQWAIGGTRNGFAILWSLKTGAEQHRLDISQQHNLICSNQHDGRQVRWTAFTPDSQTILVSSVYGTVMVWSLLLGEVVRTMQGYSPIASTLLDGTLIAAATQPDAALQPYIRIGNWKTGRQIRTIPHTDLINAIALAPQHNCLCTGHDKGDIKLWDWDTGAYRTAYQHPCWVHAVLLHPDRPLLISAGGGFIRDYTIQLWDLTTDQAIGILAGHDGNINCMALSPDGLSLATGSNDCKIKLWDLATQAELATLTGHWQQITAVSFTPDGRQIVSASHDGSLRIWGLPPGLPTPVESLG
jgi:WD40 repeat protein